MTNALAWDIMNKVVLAKASKLDLGDCITIHSSMDWDNGVALMTKKGTIHVLGTGQVVDEDDVLNYGRDCL